VGLKARESLPGKRMSPDHFRSSEAHCASKRSTKGASPHLGADAGLFPPPPCAVAPLPIRIGGWARASVVATTGD
jgi:hypothetical protein